MTTLEQLYQQGVLATLTLAQVRAAYFPHLKTDKRLRALIKSGEVALVTASSRRPG